MKNIAGENWGVSGKMNTGKTHTTMEFVMGLQKVCNKPILIFDPIGNTSYHNIGQTITAEQVNQYHLEDGGIYRLTPYREELDHFYEHITFNIRNIILVLDDVAGYFRGNLNSIQMNFVKQSKNNGIDTFFQFHDIADVAPKLLTSLQMIILKEQNIHTIPIKIPSAAKLQILHDEIVAENDKSPQGELWSYRVYDLYQDLVFLEKEGIMNQLNGREYFKKKLNKTK
jgi:hypothetical protein